MRCSIEGKLIIFLSNREDREIRIWILEITSSSGCGVNHYKSPQKIKKKNLHNISLPSPSLCVCAFTLASLLFNVNFLYLVLESLFGLSVSNNPEEIVCCKDHLCQEKQTKNFLQFLNVLIALVVESPLIRAFR